VDARWPARPAVSVGKSGSYVVRVAANESPGGRAAARGRVAGHARVRAAEDGRAAGPLRTPGDTKGCEVGAEGALRRFAAVVDLDGFPRAPYPQPALAFAAGNGTGDAAADRAYADAVATLLANSSTGGYGVTVPGASVLAFTDAPLYLPPLPEAVGRLGRRGGPRVTAAATRELLDAVRAGRAPCLEPFGVVTAPVARR
jgi:hypothetical protein